MFDMMALKSQARRVLHDTLSIPVIYKHEPMVKHEDLNVRIHSKISRFGDLLDHGWAEYIENVNRIIFNREQLGEKQLILKSGGVVTSDFKDIIIKWKLIASEPLEGPVEVIWQVSQIS